MIGRRRFLAGVAVSLPAVQVIDWEAEPRGKVADFAERGFIGLQNHDDQSPAYFRNIFIKELRVGVGVSIE